MMWRKSNSHKHDHQTQTCESRRKHQDLSAVTVKRKPPKETKHTWTWEITPGWKETELRTVPHWEKKTSNAPAERGKRVTETWDTFRVIITEKTAASWMKENTDTHIWLSAFRVLPAVARKRSTSRCVCVCVCVLLKLKVQEGESYNRNNFRKPNTWKHTWPRYSQKKQAQTIPGPCPVLCSWGNCVCDFHAFLKRIVEPNNIKAIKALFTSFRDTEAWPVRIQTHALPGNNPQIPVRKRWFCPAVKWRKSHQLPMTIMRESIGIQLIYVIKANVRSATHLINKMYLFNEINKYFLI